MNLTAYFVVAIMNYSVIRSNWDSVITVAEIYIVNLVDKTKLSCNTPAYAVPQFL